MDIPRGIDGIDSEWMSAAIGSQVTVTSCTRIGEGYGLASDVARVRLDGFPEPSVVVKLWPVDRRAGTTEVSFYRELSDEVAGVPRCHQADIDDEVGVLVLEDLHARQGDVLMTESEDSLHRITRWLAGLHARWWDDASLGKLSWLRDGRRQDLDRAWIESRSNRFAERFGTPGSPLADQLFRRVAGALAVANQRLASMPATLVHGDLHLDNIMFVAGEPRVIDWAGVRRGPGAQDLVNVLFGMAEPRQVDALLETYREGLLQAEIPVSHRHLERWVGGAVLWAFVFWTLGTAMWEPGDERSEAMQRQAIDQAVVMVETWSQRDGDLLNQVLG